VDAGAATLQVLAVDSNDALLALPDAQFAQDGVCTLVVLPGAGGQSGLLLNRMRSRRAERAGRASPQAPPGGSPGHAVAPGVVPSPDGATDPVAMCQVGKRFDRARVVRGIGLSIPRGVIASDSEIGHRE
jgi:hypothetical protein